MDSTCVGLGGQESLEHSNFYMQIRIRSYEALVEEPVVTLSMIITRGVAEIEHTHGCDERDRTNLRVHVVRIGPCGACSSMIQELCEKRDVLKAGDGVEGAEEDAPSGMTSVIRGSAHMGS